MSTRMQNPGGGVRDHGLLLGLADDDHLQYHTDARGDARYAQRSNNLSDLSDAATARTNLGLGSGGAGDIWVHRAGDTMTGMLAVSVPTATVTGLRLKSTDDSAVLPLLDLQTSAGVSVLSARTAMLSDGTNSLVTMAGVLPAVPITSAIAVSLNVTGAGSATQSQTAVLISLLAGYTGISSTSGLSVSNASAGLAANLNTGNIGISGTSIGATSTGFNIGIKGQATSSATLNVGGTGLAGTATAGSNVGLSGRALNGTTSNIGGLFTLSNTVLPTLTDSAAIIADNMATSAAIALFRDGGVKVFQVLDGGGTSITLTNSASVGLTVTGAASQSGKYLLIQDSSSVEIISVSPSPSSTVGSLNVTTVATSGASAHGFILSFTGAGSSGTQRGMSIIYNAGYTGNFTQAATFTNTALAIGASLGLGNIGAQATVSGAGSGWNTGFYGIASGSTTLNLSVAASSVSSTAGDNIGVFGRGLNAGAGKQIAGMFVLQTTTPTLESAALIADNGSTTSLIFAARDNNTKVFEVRDGGQVYLSGGSIANDGTQNFLNITETLPTVPTNTVAGVSIDITSAGSASQQQRAVSINLGAGYTGTSPTSALIVTAAAAGTSANGTAGNRAINGQATAPTAGYNFGIYGLASGSTTLNAALRAQATASNAGTNIGVFSQVINSAASNIAGLFALSAGTVIPTLESAALIADNIATTSPIFLARDNGTQVFSIADGGAVVLTLTNSASIGLIVKGAASQSANLQEWQNSSSVIQWQITSAGVLSSTAQSAGTTVFQLGASGTVSATWLASGALRIGTTSTPAALLDVINTNSSRIGLIVRHATGSVNMTEWQQSDATVLSTVNRNGYFTTRKTSAPADAELAAGEAAYWLDSTNGASKFMIKAKSADGTVVTAAVPLA